MELLSRSQRPPPEPRFRRPSRPVSRAKNEPAISASEANTVPFVRLQISTRPHAGAKMRDCSVPGKVAATALSRDAFSHAENENEKSASGQGSSDDANQHYVIHGRLLR